MPRAPIRQSVRGAEGPEGVSMHLALLTKDKPHETWCQCLLHHVQADMRGQQLGNAVEAREVAFGRPRAVRTQAGRPHARGLSEGTR